MCHQMTGIVTNTSRATITPFPSLNDTKTQLSIQHFLNDWKWVNFELHRFKCDCCCKFISMKCGKMIGNRMCNEFLWSNPLRWVRTKCEWENRWKFPLITVDIDCECKLFSHSRLAFCIHVDVSNEIVLHKCKQLMKEMKKEAME